MAELNPSRIREARIMRSLTLEELAGVVGVSKQAISKYETGKTNPSTDTLYSIMKALDVPLMFLSKPDFDVKGALNCGQFYFRTLKKTKNVEVEFANTQIKWFSEIVNVLSNDGKDFETNLPKVIDGLSISEVAIKVRELWGVGLDPISDLTKIFEKNGIFVTTANMENSVVDAYSQIINGQIFIVLNSAKGSAVRQRFNLAHELGHILLHNNIKGNESKEIAEKIEKEANKFASELLLPSRVFKEEFVDEKLKFLISLKKRWGISIAALMYRAQELDLITNEKYRSLNKQLASRGWKKIEPFDDEIPHEKPTLFSNIINSRIGNKSEASFFLSEVRFAPRDVENVLLLESNYFDRFGAELIDEQINELDSFQLSLFDI